MTFEASSEDREFVARSPRVDTSFDVLVRYGGGEFQARMMNLSGKGFRLRSPQALEPGWEVLLKVAKLPPVKGVIRWAAGEDAGGLFLEPMAL